MNVVPVSVPPNVQEARRPDLAARAATEGFAAAGSTAAIQASRQRIVVTGDESARIGQQPHRRPVQPDRTRTGEAEPGTDRRPAFSIPAFTPGAMPVAGFVAQLLAQQDRADDFDGDQPAPESRGFAAYDRATQAMAPPTGIPEPAQFFPPLPSGHLLDLSI